MLRIDGFYTRGQDYSEHLQRLIPSLKNLVHELNQQKMERHLWLENVLSILDDFENIGLRETRLDYARAIEKILLKWRGTRPKATDDGYALVKIND